MIVHFIYLLKIIGLGFNLFRKKFVTAYQIKSINVVVIKSQNRTVYIIPIYILFFFYVDRVGVKDFVTLK